MTNDLELRYEEKFPYQKASGPSCRDAQYKDYHFVYIISEKNSTGAFLHF